MCQFFSCVSDGNGEVKHFNLKDIVEMMAQGNPKDYSWNSHTSICQFHGINSKKEDSWNKWEYDPVAKTLKVDSLVTTDDSCLVKVYLEKFFEGKDIGYLRNLYNRNSGNWNSGNWNSGNGNSGDRNSGHRNSGNWNSGNWNSGNRNSGHRNSGDGNSGNWNSGHWNSGNWNSGNGVINHFCTTRQFILFDKKCTEDEAEKVYELDWSWFLPEIWVSGGDMTDSEKASHPYWNTTGGYLKTIPCMEAWAKCPKEFLTKIKKLKNFNAKKFKSISGIKV